MHSNEKDHINSEILEEQAALCIQNHLFQVLVLGREIYPGNSYSVKYAADVIFSTSFVQVLNL